MREGVRGVRGEVGSFGEPLFIIQSDAVRALEKWQLAHSVAQARS